MSKLWNQIFGKRQEEAVAEVKQQRELTDDEKHSYRYFLQYSFIPDLVAGVSKGEILQNKLYYVPIDFGKGSINLVSGFEHTKYLLLHNHETRMLLELSGIGPKFYTATTLREKGFEPTGEYYLGFDIKSVNPIEIEGLDIATIDLYGKGKQSTRPYFTTLKELK